MFKIIQVYSIFYPVKSIMDYNSRVWNFFKLEKTWILSIAH
jgi:hypothetical protein